MIFRNIIVVGILATILCVGCSKTSPTPSGGNTTTVNGTTVTNSGNSNSSTWSVNGTTYNVSSGYPTYISAAGLTYLYASGTNSSSSYGDNSLLYFYFGTSSPSTGNYQVYGGSNSNVPANNVYVYLIQSSSSSSNSYTGSFVASSVGGVVQVTNNAGSLSAKFTNLKFYGASTYKTSGGSTIYHAQDSVVVSSNLAQ